MLEWKVWEGEQSLHRRMKRSYFVPATPAGPRIQDNALTGRRITRFLVPTRIESLGDGCFRNCHHLSTVTFAPQSCLQRIGRNASLDVSPSRRWRLKQARNFNVSLRQLLAIAAHWNLFLFPREFVHWGNSLSIVVPACIRWFSNPSPSLRGCASGVLQK
jgi:hypothetical protein